MLARWVACTIMIVTESNNHLPGDPAMLDRINPNDVTAYLQDNGTYSAILAMNDADLEGLAKALSDALTVARNAICLRDMRGEKRP